MPVRMTQSTLERIFARRKTPWQEGVGYSLAPTINPNKYLKKASFLNSYRTVRSLDCLHPGNHIHAEWMPVDMVADVEEAIFHLWLHMVIEAREGDPVEEYVAYSYPDDYRFEIGLSFLRDDFRIVETTAAGFLEIYTGYADWLVREGAIRREEVLSMMDGEQALEVYHVLSTGFGEWFVGATRNWYFFADCGIYD